MLFLHNQIPSQILEDMISALLVEEKIINAKDLEIDSQHKNALYTWDNSKKINWMLLLLKKRSHNLD